MTAPAKAAPECPICKKPSDPVLRPFCSKRCADVDLQRWFTGRYAIPAAPSDEDEVARQARDDDED